MKKNKWLLLIVFAILLIIITWLVREGNNKNTFFYIGYGKEWMATCTYSLVDNIYYRTISFQYLLDEQISADEIERLREEIGEINFTLDGELTRVESIRPLELEPYLSNTISDYLKEVKYWEERKIKVEIKWKDNTDNFEMVPLK